MRRIAVPAAALLALVPIGGPAAEAAQRRPETVLMNSSEAGRKAQEEWGYADAVISGDMIYLSGVVVGLRPGETDMAAAYDRAYRHVGTILARAGASFDDVVDVTSFHTDIVAQAKIMSGVQKNYLKAPFPAWTAIDVARLIPDGGITEIKFVARRPGAPAGQ